MGLPLASDGSCFGGTFQRCTRDDAWRTMGVNGSLMVAVVRDTDYGRLLSLYS